MNKLSDLRKDIDLIDDQLIDLLNKRFNLSIEVKQVKKENNIEVLDSKREQDILNKIIDVKANDDIKYAISEVYKSILTNSKNLQK